ncbi:MAG: type II secretion system protein [Candidatus Riflebacteria bacterium]|nr:type II secretion system protein [Candidatus Riflebacteria bacterium]
MSDRKRGLTLLEVLIGAVILAIIAVPVGYLITSSSKRVMSTDTLREARAVMDQIMGKIESTDFVILYRNFGWGLQPDSPYPHVPEASGAMKTAIFADGKDPLYLGQEIINQMKSGGWNAVLQFRFLTKPEVEMDTSNRLKSLSGVLHLQAGVIKLTLTGPGVKEEIKEVLYCPMILGRPGLLLKQCPAVNPALRDQEFKNYP